MFSVLKPCKTIVRPDALVAVITNTSLHNPNFLFLSFFFLGQEFFHSYKHKLSRQSVRTKSSYLINTKVSSWQYQCLHHQKEIFITNKFLAFSHNIFALISFFPLPLFLSVAFFLYFI